MVTTQSGTNNSFTFDPGSLKPGPYILRVVFDAGDNPLAGELIANLFFEFDLQGVVEEDPTMEPTEDWAEDSTGGAEQRLKVPPHSNEAEQSLLGGLMLDHSSWDKIADVVSEQDFYRKDHQLIFASIAALAQEANPCDVVTVSEHLDNRGKLEQAGGLEYLATLANETPGAANARSYARILRERSMLRSLISAGNEISGAAFSTDGRTAAEIVDEAERLVFEIAEWIVSAGFDLPLILDGELVAGVQPVLVG